MRRNPVAKALRSAVCRPKTFRDRKAAMKRGDTKHKSDQRKLWS